MLSFRVAFWETRILCQVIVLFYVIYVLG
ncbi:hypothetical protein [Plasmodium yoelii yoelii]|uniref:Uncharacterized protein n=1 Tax=Plasmodium yoelii yoelii TaxID=73239 RepID=Q7PD70_PLAYO|nr:hypothetical protein [Plasmodium yoelii yoelii]EAA20952.1 hypothetical protein [Plasmodium yoelii yoelii]